MRSKKIWHVLGLLLFCMTGCSREIEIAHSPSSMRDLPAVIRASQGAVFTLISRGGDGEHEATAFVIDRKKKLLLTSAHSVEEATRGVSLKGTVL